METMAIPANRPSRAITVSNSIMVKPELFFKDIVVCQNLIFFNINRQNPEKVYYFLVIRFQKGHFGVFLGQAFAFP